MEKNEKKRATLTQKLMLSAVSTAFCLGLLGLGEIYCRYFLDINLRKTSKEFVAVDESGHIVGNAKNAQGVSFGTDVYSDENGFRVPAGFTQKPNDAAVLLLGDSVAFGVGVPEERTFAGLFRKRQPDVTVYNSSAPGYGLDNYEQVVRDFFPKHPEIKWVYLFYCLNDFQVPADLRAKPETNSGALRSIKNAVASVFVDMNEFLGPRSKLYVYVTGKTADPSQKYFLWDLSLMNVDDATLAATLQPIVEIDKLVQSRGVKLKVFINPYEFQIREGDNANYEPQRRVEEFLTANAIEFVDTRDRFKGLHDSSEAFLFADPMHLNERGHQIAFEALHDNWQTSH